MNTRGLTELVILTIGLSLGVLSDRTFAMMVIMALTTTIMAAPLINLIMPREAILKQIATAGDVSATPTASRILVGLTSPQTAQPLVHFAKLLVDEKRPAEIILVHLLPTARAPELRSGLSESESMVSASSDSLRRLVEAVEASGIRARSMSFLSDAPAADLTDIALDRGVDAILLPFWRPDGNQDHGDLVQELNGLTGPEIVVFGGDPYSPLQLGRGEVIMLNVSGSEAEALARTAAGLARALDDSLRIMSGAEQTTSSSRYLVDLADSIREEYSIWATTDLQRRDVVAAAIEASSDADAIVVPLRQTGVVNEVDLRIMSLASCPVIFVSPPRIGMSDERSRNPRWPFLVPRQEPDGQIELAPALVGPQLQLLDPWGRNLASHPLSARLRVGRSTTNDLILAEDRLVSRSHATIWQRNGGFVLQDHSTNGTVVWRAGGWLSVENADLLLEDDDLLVVGANVFRFSFGQPADREERAGDKVAAD